MPLRSNHGRTYCLANSVLRLGSDGSLWNTYCRFTPTTGSLKAVIPDRLRQCLYRFSNSITPLFYFVNIFFAFLQKIFSYLCLLALYPAESVQLNYNKSDWSACHCGKHGRPELVYIADVYSKHCHQRIYNKIRYI